MKSNIGAVVSTRMEDKERSAQVTAIEDHKEQRVQRKLNSVVQVKGRGTVLLREGFCPNLAAVVVIRRKDGSYLDPCDFSSYLLQRKKAYDRKKVKWTSLRDIS